MVQELATQWLQSNPCRAKSSQETEKSLRKFLEPSPDPKVIFTDNSLEFGKVFQDLFLNHCTSPPHRSETNGIAERAVRRVEQGTSAILLQLGVDQTVVGRSHGILPFSVKRSSSLIGQENTSRTAIWILIQWTNKYHPISAQDQASSLVYVSYARHRERRHFGRGR